MSCTAKSATDPAETPAEFPQNHAEVIQKHSRSFSLAARMLPAEFRSDVQQLYAWCRWCDDAVDSAATKEDAEQQLRVLREDVERIDRGDRLRHPASRWLAVLVSKYDIPRDYPLA
ncbi:MAG: squalene/phytoene synthase family protein, partial [Planctomycetota bacterium]